MIIGGGIREDDLPVAAENEGTGSVIGGSGNTRLGIRGESSDVPTLRREDVRGGGTRMNAGRGGEGVRIVRRGVVARTGYCGRDVLDAEGGVVAAASCSSSEMAGWLTLNWCEGEGRRA